MRFLGMQDMDEIGRMTFYEYELRMRAHILRMVDAEYLIYLQAWAGREVMQKKKVGKDKWKFVYEKFSDFFDMEKRIRQVTGEVPVKVTRNDTIGSRAMAYMERRKRDGKL